MATLVAVSEVQVEERRRVTIRQFGSAATGAGVAALLTGPAIAISGYHPCADDGGLYLAGVKRLLDPSLYPQYTAFVLEPTRHSVFAATVAAVVRTTHVGLPTILLCLHALTIWTTLFAAWLVASRCWRSTKAAVGATSLLACWLSLPVAGTALALMDPYLTARSFSTALGLLAVAAAVDASQESGARRTMVLALCATALGGATAMHPLMAGYCAIAVLLLVMMSTGGRRGVLAGAGFCVGLVFVACVASVCSPAEPMAASIAALSRTYWFPAEWRWYELAGLIAPLGLLAAYIRFERMLRPPASALISATLLFGTTALVIAAAFCRTAMASHAIAPLQPLRAFHLVYLVLVIVLGAEFGDRMLRRRKALWACVIVLAAVPLYMAERNTYSSSSHLEFGIGRSANRWVRGFRWIAANTSRDAVFALDSDYIDAPHEDAQTFRSIAERSSVPDFSKDGGEASIAPDLAAEWLAGANAQKHLDGGASVAPEEADRVRASKLAGTGADWIVLQANSPTALACSYSNEALKVCRLADAGTKEKLPR